jgi:hypothetical protein
MYFSPLKSAERKGETFFVFGQDLLDFTGYSIFYFQNFPDESDEE